MSRTSAQALFARAKRQKQLKRPSADTGIDKTHIYIHTVECSSAIKGNEVLIRCYNVDEPGPHVQ